jgi:hypothetical protein
VRFFEESVLTTYDANAWVAYIQGQLRRHYAVLLARSLERGHPPDAATQRTLDVLAQDFYGALGIAEGLMASKDGYAAGVVSGFLDKARQATPPDVAKEDLSRFFYIRGVLRVNVADASGALRDLQTSVSVWPSPANPAFKELQNHLRRSGDEAGANAVGERVKQLKSARAR